MTNDANEKEIRKLTAEDLPELADDDAKPEGDYYCRFFKETWTGWVETKCSSEYASEGDCSSAARNAGADAYSWTGKSC